MFMSSGVLADFYTEFCCVGTCVFGVRQAARELEEQCCPRSVLGGAVDRHCHPFSLAEFTSETPQGSVFSLLPSLQIDFFLKLFLLISLPLFQRLGFLVLNVPGKSLAFLALRLMSIRKMSVRLSDTVLRQ